MSLLKIAREFLESRLLGKEFDFPDEVKEQFEDSCGMFVILRKNRRIRGTAALIRTAWPMWRTMMELVAIAAFQDPRNKPVEPDEVEDIEIEIYLMEEPEKVEAHDHADYLEEIEIGEDGLIVDCEGRTEALLPSVVKECASQGEELLDCVCKKMDFSPGVWKEVDCEVWKFRVKKLEE